MSPSTFQLVKDANGNYIFGGSPPSDDFDQSFKSFNDGVDYTEKWATLASLISGVVMVAAIVTIAYALIVRLKKAGTAIPGYARIATGDTDKASNSHLPSNDIEKAETSPLPVHRDSQVEDATMERFLSNMAREKPIRISPQQLAGFTENYSTKLGSGDFGVVFKGQFLEEDYESESSSSWVYDKITCFRS